MRTLIALALLLAMSGCATFEYASMQNRVACPVGAGPGLVVSMWGLFGIATIIASEDTQAICTR